MKEFFRSRGFKLLATASIVLCAAMIYTAALGSGGMSSVTSSLVGLITTPMQWLSTVGSQSLNDLTANAKEVQAMQEKLNALQNELDEKNEQLSDYYELQRQNEELRKYLDLRDEHSDWTFVDAAVVGRDTNELFYGFTINKGSLAGIHAGDPVITASGLVGRVEKVSTTYAKVTTIFHPEVSVSVLEPRTGEIGVLSGDKLYADSGLVQMKFLDAKTELRAGDLIIASGMGGVYPQKLIIGTVQEVVGSRIDVSKTAIVRPAADIQNTTAVMVITSFTGKGETMDNLNEN